MVDGIIDSGFLIFVQINGVYCTWKYFSRAETIVNPDKCDGVYPLILLDVRASCGGPQIKRDRPFVEKK